MQIILSVFVFMFVAAFALSVPGSAGAVRVRPEVVENGSDLALFNFTGGIARAVAFGPDGSSYSIVRSGILKVAPDGSQSFVFANEYARTIPNDYQNIVYAGGFLWFEVYHGLVRIRLDGSDHRYFQFNYATGIGRLENMIAGGDGLYFDTTTTIGRIGYSDSKLTLFPNSSNVGESFIWSPDGHLDYVSSGSVYVAKPTPHYVQRTNLLQIAADGTTRVLGTASGCANTRNLVVSLGAIYYVGRQYDANGNAIGQALCRATLGGKIGPITPVWFR